MRYSSSYGKTVMQSVAGGLVMAGTGKCSHRKNERRQYKNGTFTSKCSDYKSCMYNEYKISLQ